MSCSVAPRTVRYTISTTMGASQQAALEAMRFVIKFNQIILVPLIALLMGVAFLVFLYGAAEYIINAEDDGARATGRTHMLWGIIGLVVMVSALALLQIVAATFGLNQMLDCGINPTLPGCNNPGLFQIRF